jgi:hypothetical protein
VLDERATFPGPPPVSVEALDVFRLDLVLCYNLPNGIQSG